VLVDLERRLGDEDVTRLLEEASGSVAAAERAAARYRARDWTLLGHEENGVLVGCIGVEVIGPARDTPGDPPRVVLHSVAVAPRFRGRGVGRQLVRGVAARFPGGTLEAETDSEALAFYRRIGFRVESLGEKYPGVERFRCVLHAAAEAFGSRS
jgi:ribosomal protein S18 acetylase RimI-like enzyme